MDDRHRSQNVKIRGIPETVIQEDLTRRLLTSLLTPQHVNQVVIDGLYRILRATRAPRDVILQLQKINKLHGSSARRIYSPLRKCRSVFLPGPVQAYLGMEKPIQTTDHRALPTRYPLPLGIPQEPGHHAWWSYKPSNRHI
ncbi:Hypothetical predicted protein [Pelobates cultripes]|uniref:Uncharacterized protein n=1 Tax=Pelobates cultripes TaxID=61616 RepID=A0AAD1SZC7_PELCU|nr:Hypothetical predicted protein [Pelobates cultripes]